MKTMKPKIKGTLYFIILSMILSGCSKFQTPITKRSQMTLLSKKEELDIGEKEYRNVVKNCNACTDKKKLEAIERVSQQLLHSVEEYNYKWEFVLVENDSVNAICLPGGKVVLNSGIFKVAKNDDQIAAIIAHEMAHAISRHGNARISRSRVLNGVQGTGAVLTALLNPLLVIPFVLTYSGVTHELIISPHSKMEEQEADVIGLNLMHKAGYNMDETITLWQNIKKVNHHKRKMRSSTHASYDERESDIKKAIERIKAKK
jgi:predicted Zn-dependent protease